ncbi:hypothetical protein MESS4_790117 [Mesorhizobium sp. STM 4661]|nr:hypothetical protein MESS4_790117 [Mesorhizobium sp. STM 4661]
MPGRRSRSSRACLHLPTSQRLMGRRNGSLSAQVRGAAGPDIGLPTLTRRSPLSVR